MKLRGAAALLVVAIGGGILALVTVALGGVAEAAPPNADIAVTVTGSPPVAKIGDVVTFVVTVINNGPDAFPLTQLTDTPPAELSNATWSCSSTGGVVCPVAAGTGFIDLTTSYPAGGTLTVTIIGTVIAMPVAGQIVNQASANSTAGFPDSNPTNNFSQAIVLVADLRVAKSVSPPDIQLGALLTYTLTMTNAGLGDFTDAVVVDDLSGDLDDATFGTASADGGVVSVVLPQLTWSGTVPGEGTVTVTYSLTVNDPATGDGVLANGVVSNAGNCPVGSTDPACSTEVTTPSTTSTTTTTTAATRPPPRRHRRRSPRRLRRPRASRSRRPCRRARSTPR